MRTPRACNVSLLFRTIAVTASLTHAAHAQPDPRQIFAPLNLPEPPGPFRSAGGIPGPAYWQNRADYSIAASIDPATSTLTASETITYTNNSPDPLDVLWLQLDQNIYRQDARANLRGSPEPRPDFAHADGDILDSISIERDGQQTTPASLVNDTRLQLRPATTIAPHTSVKLHIAWHYTVPGDWGGRTAVTTTRNGALYEIAQWFPRMAVYDDLRGWDTAPYLGSEFYLEYGTIDYAVTVPWNYIVAGSGELQNPGQVLTQTQRTRLAQAAASDATILIRTPAEVTDPASRPTRSGTQTWRFHMAQTRDVAFTASPAFVWDAARINLPGGKHALAMSVYPVDSVGPTKWNRSTAYVKFAIEHFSAKWFSYPWPVMVNLGGHGASMEYPGIVFDDQKDEGKPLFWITVHEVGHSWFPMIVGSNERRDAWMDEGFNTFIDVDASDAFNKGEFAPKRDPEYAEHGGNPVDEILPILADPAAPIILTPADQISEKYRHAISYFKPALGLVLLRDQILGPARFDQAFRHYIAAWAYKHPSPSDFFRLMSSDAGEDLSWWWRGWYFSTSAMDLAILKSNYVDNNPAHGLALTLQARAPLVMPSTLELTTADGRTTRIALPVETFFQTNPATITLPTTARITHITLDPGHALPDADRANNSAPGPG